MSFGRHAYRHAIQPSPSGLIDHVWISEEFLASAFRRFANGQRRYESRVPGPLEARRRLAKRRNTALAGIAGTGPLDDIACLFGRNGREHLKWTDGRKAPRETKGSHFYQLSTPPPPPPVYNENVDPDEFKPPGWPEVPDGADEVSRDQYLKRRLRECHTVSSVKRVVRQLDIDLLREPGYSRLIFDHLLSCSVRGELAVGELTSFLDDPHLNIRGARNYLTAVEHVVLRGTSHAKWRTLFDNVIQALELGLIPPEELCAIIETLPKSTPAKSGKGRQPLYSVTVMYQAMWDAIGRCDIYGHNDLDEGLVDAWLGAMWERNVCEDLPLAKSILLAAQNLESACCSWATLFITRWLELPKRLRVETDEVYASEILSSLKPDAAAAAIISTTEFLMSSKKTSLLGRWHSCLSQIQEIPSLVSSNPWIDIESQCDVPESTFSPQHQIILRLWALRTLSRSLPDGPLWRKDVRATDIPITRLLSLYELFRKDVAEHDMLSSLMKGIHDLSMPANGLLMLAVDLKARNSITRSTRQTLTKLETSNISFADVFADLGAYNSMAPHFFSKFEKMARQIDITSPEFIEHGLDLARTGDSKSVWTLIRLLRSHTPLKIALSKSWVPIPDASEKALVRYYPEPRTSDCPDPHAALEMIHLIAVSLACSKRLSPRRSYSLVHWLYVFLVKHNAPVKPTLARAMYHAGVERFRRQGLRVAPTQYAYIFDVVEEVEGPDVAADLMDLPRMEHRISRYDEEGHYSN